MGPCDWPVNYATCEGDVCSHMDSVDPIVVPIIEQQAAYWLWEATLRRFSNCPVTLLPCNRRCASYGASPPWVPYRTAGGWVNVACGRCGLDCSCTFVDNLILPTAGTVLAVEIDGDVLSVDAWRVYNRRHLTRIDGGSWPTCQDLAYVTTPNFSVTYIPGAEVPEMGGILAGQLACQIARRICGQSCELPANATAVTRQGVSILIEPGTATGIWIIDQWVEMMNKAVSKVWTPESRVPFIAPVTATSP